MISKRNEEMHQKDVKEKKTAEFNDFRNKTLISEQGF